MVETKTNSLTAPGVTNPLFFGDSLTAGQNASSPGICWVSQLCSARYWTPTNNGVGGQTVTTGTDNPFNPSSIPTKPANNNILFMGWGINDCWKSPSLAQFTTDYTTCINNALAKSYTVILITGFFCLDNAFFTVAQYMTYVNQTITIAANTGVRVLNLFTYMQNNGGASLLQDGIVHVNDQGSTIIKNYLNANI